MRNPPVQPPKQDASGRRFRHQRRSTGKRIEPTEIDIRRFEFLQRHGDLPTPFIHEYTAGQAKNIHATRKRLGHLFHESNTPHNGPYLERNHNQWHTMRADYNFCVYRINERTKRLLKSVGWFVAETPRPSSSWKHDFLRACYSASMELYCRRYQNEFEYIPHHEIVQRIGKDSFSVQGAEFIPDVLHGIRYKKTNAVRLFMVEIDCHTEQVSKTFERKLDTYYRYFRSKVYQDDFKISGGVMLAVVTTNRTHMHNLMALTKENNFMLFNVVDGFDFGLKPPEQPFDLFTRPWYRPGMECFYMDQS